MFVRDKEMKTVAIYTEKQRIYGAETAMFSLFVVSGVPVRSDDTPDARHRRADGVSEVRNLKLY